MSDRRDRDRARLCDLTEIPGRATGVCQGRCYYCGRWLVVAAPISEQKAAALRGDLLTCGPCVHVHGRLPWRAGEPCGRASAYSRERQRIKRAMRDA
jgi:hypothetical protein